MSDVEASAMWVESNVSFTAAHTILRHLRAKFHHRIQVPFTRISALSNITTKITPLFGEFKYAKDIAREKSQK